MSFNEMPPSFNSANDNVPDSSKKETADSENAPQESALDLLQEDKKLHQLFIDKTQEWINKCIEPEQKQKKEVLVRVTPFLIKRLAVTMPQELLTEEGIEKYLASPEVQTVITDFAVAQLPNESSVQRYAVDSRGTVTRVESSSDIIQAAEDDKESKK